MVRRFVKEDFPKIFEIGREMHQESSFRDLSYSFQRVASLVARCITDDSFLGLIDEDKDGTVGIFIGHIVPFFFSDELISDDMVLYVKKEKRGGSTAFKFIREYEKWAKERGASQIQIGTSTGIDEDRTVKFFERLGYKKSGVLLKK
jgi:GNAT superfamily N-acetyltransferase